MRMRRRSGNFPNKTPSDKTSRDKTSHADARSTAIGLLARREHAQSEITRKLRARGYDDGVTTEVVDELSRQRLISDERFAEAFIRSRTERGQGPTRLKAVLRQLKVPPELITKYLVTIAIPWARLAADVRVGKFGQSPPGNLSERAKQVRFLQYRGFTADQIRAALGTACEDDLFEVGDDSDSSDVDADSGSDS